MTGAAPAGLGLRARKGGAVAVIVAVRGATPELVASMVLTTHAEGDRLALEPYGVAHEMVREHGAAPEEAAAVVAQGRKRQDGLAEVGVRQILERIGGATIHAGLLVNRAGWVTGLLAYSLEWADHVPVAEGLAVREALRFALGTCGVATIELDEKALIDRAVDILGQPSVTIESEIKRLGSVAGKPWRKEQKAACLAAWVAASQSGQA